jgi:hypothetical protein
MKKKLLVKMQLEREEKPHLLLLMELLVNAETFLMAQKPN